MGGIRSKVVIAVTIGVLSLFLEPEALAIDRDLGASLRTRVALSVGQTVEMNFGLIDYSPTHSGYLRLGTDGTLALGGGAAGIILDDTAAAAGRLPVSGDSQSNIEISCDAAGTLGDGNGNQLSLINVEHAIDTGAPFGSGTACAGLGISPTIFDLSSNPAPLILLGGEIDLSGNAIAASGTYDAAGAMGGSSIMVRVVYQ